MYIQGKQEREFVQGEVWDKKRQNIQSTKLQRQKGMRLTSKILSNKGEVGFASSYTYDSGANSIEKPKTLKQNLSLLKSLNQGKKHLKNQDWRIASMDFAETLRNLVSSTPVVQSNTNQQGANKQNTPITQQSDIMNQIGLSIKRR